jgi:hypothetical protein
VLHSVCRISLAMLDIERRIARLEIGSGTR